ncbi:hypothetical protein VNO78_09547 [Psophocarpus tetragonolobus]|uniref:SOSS complex subunit B homolog n=1 Tax=Psophocarpus tetragonolobus TaxID=3891 RepID=A0AAN9SZF2_PSOTE
MVSNFGWPRLSVFISCLLHLKLRLLSIVVVSCDNIWFPKSVNIRRNHSLTWEEPVVSRLGQGDVAVVAEGTIGEIMVLLKDIIPAAQNNIDTKFILLEKGKTTVEGQNKICMALVADETAAVHFQFWGDECNAFNSGDIISLTNGIFSYQHGNLLLRAGKRGNLAKVGEFTMVFVETPNMSEIHWIPDPNNSKSYIKEYVISPVSRIFPSPVSDM